MKKNTFIIAEIAQAHDGSLGIAHSYIDAAKKVGANAVKFQTHIAEAESSIYEPFRINFSYEDKTRMDYWKRMEFSVEEWVGLKTHCEEIGIEFLSSPFSIKAVELLEKLNITRYKIASGEVNNYLLIDSISHLKKPIILSSGLSDKKELKKTITRILKTNKNLSLLQCTSEYPTSAKSLGLNLISEFKKEFKLPVGLSDHSGRIEPALAAVTLGAEIIEAHLTFDKSMFGPDSSSSLTIDQFSQMVSGIRFLDEAIHNPAIKKSDPKTKTMFGKSLAVNRNIEKGTKLKIEDLESKKPANKGISAENYESILNKKLNKKLNKYDFIKESDLSH